MLGGVPKLSQRLNYHQNKWNYTQYVIGDDCVYLILIAVINLIAPNTPINLLLTSNFTIYDDIVYIIAK